MFFFLFSPFVGGGWGVGGGVGGQIARAGRPEAPVCAHPAPPGPPAKAGAGFAAPACPQHHD